MDPSELAEADPEQPAPRAKTEDARERVLREYEFVNAKRMDNSLGVAEELYPDGVPDHVKAKLLCITVDEVAQERAEITEKLRLLMKA